MERTFRDIIYPTIKNKFDELTLKYDDEDRHIILFEDDEGNNQIGYNRASGFIVIKMNYFMLQYFGVNFYTYDEDLNDIFIGLIRDSLGKEYHGLEVNHNNIDYV